MTCNTVLLLCTTCAVDCEDTASMAVDQGITALDGVVRLSVRSVYMLQCLQSFENERR